MACAKFSDPELTRRGGSDLEQKGVSFSNQAIVINGSFDAQWQPFTYSCFLYSYEQLEDQSKVEGWF